MGAFKPLLPFGEQTVIEACIRNLLGGGAEPIIVVVGHRAAEVREHLSHLPVIFAENPLTESEMGISIASGVEQVPLETEAVFIALVDQPAIPPAVIQHLISERRRTGAALIIPTHEGRGGHPVLVDLRYRDELLHLNAQGGLRAFFAARSQEVLRSAVASPHIARDMDTWDDYASLHEDIFGAGPR